MKSSDHGGPFYYWKSEFKQNKMDNIPQDFQFFFLVFHVKYLLLDNIYRLHFIRVWILQPGCIQNYKKVPGTALFLRQCQGF